MARAKVLWMIIGLTVLSFLNVQVCLAGAEMEVSVPYLQHPPEVDGHIEEQQWGDAAAITGARPVGDQKLSWRQVVYWLGWDEDGLYIAARSFFQPDVRPSFSQEVMSDNLELGFLPDKSGSADPFRLFMNPDQMWFCDIAGPWEVDIEKAASIEPDPDDTYGPGTRRWDMEMKIPAEAFPEMSNNEEGDVWRLLLVRNYARPWAQVHMPLGDGFFDPSGYLKATLTKDEPVARFVDVLPVLTGQKDAKLQITNPGPDTAEVGAAMKVENLTEEITAFEKEAQISVPPGEIRTLEIPRESLGMGFGDEGRLRVSAGDDTRTHLEFSSDFTMSQILVNFREDEAPALMVELEGMVFSNYPSGTFFEAGRGASKITYRSGEHARPRLSGCGEEVLLTSYDHDGEKYIWLVSIEEKSPEKLTRGAQAHWLPDDTGFVFVRDGNILRYDLETESAEKFLTGDEITDRRFPAVSPDGEKIAFVGGYATDSVLYIADLEGQVEPERIISGEINSSPDWHPEGDKIAYQDGRSIKVMDLIQEDSYGLIEEAGIHQSPVWSTEGEAVAYIYAPYPDGPRELRAVDARGKGASALIEEGIDIGADVRFSCDISDTESPEDEFWLEIHDDKGEFFFEEGKIGTIYGNMTEATVETTPHGIMLEAPDGNDFVLDLDINSVIIPDRLGDDKVVSVGEESEDVNLSHRNVAVVKTGGAKESFVVAASGKESTMEVRNNRMKINPAEGKLGIGVLGEGWPSPFHAAWRVADEEKELAAMVRGTAEDMEKFFNDSEFEEDNSSIYLFGRTAQTPRGIWTFSDHLYEFFGVEVGKEYLQEDAVREIKVADENVVYPTIELTLESMKHYSEHALEDLQGFSQDIRRILNGKDRRLNHYFAGWEELKKHSPETESIRSLLQAAMELREAREDWVLEEELKAEIESFLNDKSSENFEALKKMASVAGSERENLLRELREKTREARNKAGKLLANPKNAESEKFRLVYEKSGEMLAKRHYAEADWRGENVQRPFTRPWWEDIW